MARALQSVQAFTDQDGHRDQVAQDAGDPWMNTADIAGHLRYTGAGRLRSAHRFLVNNGVPTVRIGRRHVLARRSAIDAALERRIERKAR